MGDIPLSREHSLSLLEASSRYLSIFFREISVECVQLNCMLVEKCMATVFLVLFLLWRFFQNWSCEFRKWLGNERLKVYTVTSEKRVKVKSADLLRSNENLMKRGFKIDFIF